MVELGRDEILTAEVNFLLYAPPLATREKYPVDQ